MNEIRPVRSCPRLFPAPMEAVEYWHGTSTNLLPDGSYRLLPPTDTGKITEANRAQRTDQVFFTTSPSYARIYARIYAMRACRLFGGQPILHRVIPARDEVVCLNATKGSEVYYAPSAFIEAA